MPEADDLFLSPEDRRLRELQEKTGVYDLDMNFLKPEEVPVKDKDQREKSPHKYGVRLVKPIQFWCWNGLEKNAGAQQVTMNNVKCMDQLMSKCVLACGVSGQPLYPHTPEGRPIKRLEDIHEGQHIIVIQTGAKYNPEYLPKDLKKLMVRWQEGSLTKVRSLSGDFSEAQPDSAVVLAKQKSTDFLMDPRDREAFEGDLAALPPLKSPTSRGRRKSAEATDLGFKFPAMPRSRSPSIGGDRRGSVSRSPNSRGRSPSTSAEDRVDSVFDRLSDPNYTFGRSGSLASDTPSSRRSSNSSSGPVVIDMGRRRSTTASGASTPRSGASATLAPLPARGRTRSITSTCSSPRSGTSTTLILPEAELTHIYAWNGLDKHGTAEKIPCGKVRTFEQLVQKAAQACRVIPQPQWLYTLDGKAVVSLNEVEDGGHYLCILTGGKYNIESLPAGLHKDPAVWTEEVAKRAQRRSSVSPNARRPSLSPGRRSSVSPQPPRRLSDARSQSPTSGGDVFGRLSDPTLFQGIHADRRRSSTLAYPPVIEGSKTTKIIICWDGNDKHAAGQRISLAGVTTMEELMVKCATACSVSPTPSCLHTAKEGKPVKTLDDIVNDTDYVLIQGSNDLNRLKMPTALISKMQQPRC
uniref:Doublecortin domain-containing protein n=1 Tax=Eutreptiella gymnastica TaxID=73025 RepID=A0A7S1IZZ4_9EUGL